MSMIEIKVDSQDLYDIESFMLHHGYNTLAKHYEIRKILDKIWKQRLTPMR